MVWRRNFPDAARARLAALSSAAFWAPSWAAKSRTVASVAKALGASADGALRQVVNKAGAARARALVQMADGLVDISDVREALAGDRRLPSAWRARLDALGKALGEAARAPSPATVDRAFVVAASDYVLTVLGLEVDRALRCKRSR